MKSKHFVTLFFVVGLVFAVAAMVNLPVGNAYADSSNAGNAVEQLLGSPSPEILKSLSPGTLKALKDAVESGNTETSAPDGAVYRAAGNKDVVLPVASLDFHQVLGSAGCGIWIFGWVTATPPCSVSTGINLPDGAVIYRLEMTAIDNHATENQSLILFRQKIILAEE